MFIAAYSVITAILLVMTCWLWTEPTDLPSKEPFFLDIMIFFSIAWPLSVVIIFSMAAWDGLISLFSKTGNM